MDSTVTEVKHPTTRIKIFVDYWNFILSLNEHERFIKGNPEAKFNVDWQKVGPELTKASAAKVGTTVYSFEGMNVYASYNPKSIDSKFHPWITGWLAKQTGIHVDCLERKPKAPPKCPTCHKPIEICPHAGCGKPMTGTVEKGVDTLIVTDMIRLAWEQRYEVAVIVSSDRDFIPGVKFLDQKGLKVVHGSFPPQGSELTAACWASFDVNSLKPNIFRPTPQPPKQ